MEDKVLFQTYMFRVMKDTYPLVSHYVLDVAKCECFVQVTRRVTLPVAFEEG